MNGPDHYRKAESLLQDVMDRRRAYPEQAIAMAQVHATLALAAATAALNPVSHDPVGSSFMTGRSYEDQQRWNVALGVEDGEGL